MRREWEALKSPEEGGVKGLWSEEEGWRGGWAMNGHEAPSFSQRTMLKLKSVAAFTCIGEGYADTSASRASAEGQGVKLSGFNAACALCPRHI